MALFHVSMQVSGKSTEYLNSIKFNTNAEAIDHLTKVYNGEVGFNNCCPKKKYCYMECWKYTASCHWKLLFKWGKEEKENE